MRALLPLRRRDPLQTCLDFIRRLAGGQSLIVPVSYYNSRIASGFGLFCTACAPDPVFYREFAPEPDSESDQNQIQNQNLPCSDLV